MIPLIKKHKDDVKQLCEQHLVRRLYLFGSAAKNEFQEGSSDLDFVVEFTEDVNPIDYADNFFSLLESLKLLFGRNVDLLSYRALRNAVIIDEIEKSKVELYAT